MIVANNMLCSATESTQYTALFMALRSKIPFVGSPDNKAATLRRFMKKYCCLSVTVHEEVGSSDEKGLQAPKRLTVAVKICP